MNIESKLVTEYLLDLNSSVRPSGYLRVDRQRMVIAGYGAVSLYRLHLLEEGQPAEQCLPFLEGLIPFSKNTVEVISNVHIENSSYFDVHLVNDNDEYCFLFFENNSYAKTLQKEQQQRLDLDLREEQLRRKG